MKSMAAVLMFLMAVPAAAHGPTPRKTDQSILIKASVADVWKKLGDPCAIVDWHPDIAGCQSPDAKKRVLTLKNGGVITEEFDEVQEADSTISYRLVGEVDARAIAVSSLNGRIRLVPDGDQVKVSWMARYYRVFTGNEPPAGQDDDSAQSAVDAYIKSGLEGLQGLLGRK